MSKCEHRGKELPTSQQWLGEEDSNKLLSFLNDAWIPTLPSKLAVLGHDSFSNHSIIQLIGLSRELYSLSGGDIVKQINRSA